MVTNRTEMNDDSPRLEAQRTSRAIPWLFVTLALLVGNGIWIPISTCGCHFHAIALLSLIPTMLWAFYTLFSHRGGAERWVAWLAFLSAIFCLWLQFVANLQFFFMRS